MTRFSRYGPPFPYYKYYQYNPPMPKSITPDKNIMPPSPSKPQDPKDPVWFDLFGIKLYFDDVLILSLLFFLYKEQVKDEALFLALVLLLIS